MISYNEADKRKIIMDYYLNKRKRIDEEKHGYLSIYTHSTSCVDEITLYYNQNKNDFWFKGQGCAIFLSSCEIFIERLIEIGFENKNELVNKYQNLVNKKELNENDKQLLSKLMIFENVAKHLNRKECALIISELFKKI